jgi:hypothetical protein
VYSARGTHARFRSVETVKITARTKACRAGQWVGWHAGHVLASANCPTEPVLAWHTTLALTPTLTVPTPCLPEPSYDAELGFKFRVGRFGAARCWALALRLWGW